MRKILILSFLLAFFGLGGGSCWAYNHDSDWGNSYSDSIYHLCVSGTSTNDILDGVKYILKKDTCPKYLELIVIEIGNTSTKTEAKEIKKLLEYKLQDGTLLCEHLVLLDLGSIQIDTIWGSYTYKDGSEINFLPKTVMKNLKFFVMPKYSYVPKTLGSNLGYFMPNLETLIIPEGYTKIENESFYALGITNLQLPSTIETIEDKAFYNCKNLKNVYSKDNCLAQQNSDSKHVNAKIFYTAPYDKNKKIMVNSDFKKRIYVGAEGTCDLPKSLKSVGEEAFMGNQFKTVVLPPALKDLGANAFGEGGFYSENSYLAADQQQLTAVYMLGKDAPECWANVFGWLRPNLDDKQNSYVVEGKYQEDLKSYSRLHYRPDVTAEQKNNLVCPDLRIGDAGTAIGMWDRYGGKLYPDPIFGSARMNPDLNGYKTRVLWDYLTEGDKLQHTMGIRMFPSQRADAPLPDAEFPKYEDGKWFTLCLPMSLNAEMVKHIYGEDAEIYTLENVWRNKKTQRIHINFTKKCTTIESHKPYIVRVNNPTGHNDKLWDFTGFLDNEKEEYNRIVYDDFLTFEQKYKDGYYWEPWIYMFTGNLEGLKSESEKVDNTSIIRYRPRYAYYLGAENDEVSWYYQDTDKKRVWKPYTCALLVFNNEEKNHESYQTDLTPGLTVDDAFRDDSGNIIKKDGVSSNLGEDATTGIDYNNIDFVTPDRYVDGNVYTLSGQLVRHNSTTTDGLPKGIYVCNGRKIMVK